MGRKESNKQTNKTFVMRKPALCKCENKGLMGIWAKNMCIYMGVRKFRPFIYFRFKKGGLSYTFPLRYKLRQKRKCINESFVFVILSCLFIAALWSPAGKCWPLGSHVCVFVTFPCDVLGQVWYLIVSILDLCLLDHELLIEFCISKTTLYIKQNDTC